MTHPDIDYLILMERRRDQLAAAAHSRMVKEALAGKRLRASQKRHFNFDRLGEMIVAGLAHFLSFAGERMIAWSCRLQYRRVLLSQHAVEEQPAPCT